MPSMRDEINAARRAGYAIGLAHAKRNWVTDPVKTAEISKEIERMMKGGEMPTPPSKPEPRHP